MIEFAVESGSGGENGFDDGHFPVLPFFDDGQFPVGSARSFILIMESGIVAFWGCVC